MKKTKDSLDLRPDDSKMSKMMSTTMRLGGPSEQDGFNETFDAEKMIQTANDRYGSLTVRNKDAKGKQFPPRLSPRPSNKSVDPHGRKASLMTNIPNKTSTGFGIGITSSFA